MRAAGAYGRLCPQSTKTARLLYAGDPTAMIRNRRIRRIGAGALIGAGVLLLVLAPSVRAGLGFFALGIVLELVGLALEHREPPG